ncbi:MAG: hypothetical protein M1827_007583 [Pycnora praestabilis]|nr:MAG: hypothetical protein M1827_007583 [Pycnora praestabilis]
MGMTNKDRAVSEDITIHRLTNDTLRESYKQGVRGYAEEARLLYYLGLSSWKDMALEAVELWYGTAVVFTSFSMKRYRAEHLPNAFLKGYPGDTNLTISMNHGKEIMQDLLATG